MLSVNLQAAVFVSHKLSDFPFHFLIQKLEVGVPYSAPQVFI